MALSPAASTISTLRTTVKGAVFTPDDESYDEVRTIFPGGVDRRPAVIVRPTDAADVVQAITFARHSGLPLAVRSGGHTIHATTDDGIVLDLRDMKRLTVDAGARTAWAETGLTAAEYSSGVGEYGLATGFGDTGSVGIGGITLGGGIGYLTRKYGLTIDSVLAAELVTADGDVLHVDDASHPNLFWAIRGGGGNFGVVTRFLYRLHPVSQVVGGMLLLPATSDVIAGVIEAADAAPEELSAIVNVMPAPPLPFVPPSHHGQLVVMVLLCCVGDVEAANAAVAPFRKIAKPIADLVRPMKYPEIFPPDDSSYHPKAIGRTLFMDSVDAHVAGTMLDFLGRSDASLRVAQLRALGGAMARVPADATAFAHRQNRIIAVVASFYDGARDRPVREQWVKDFAAALDQGEPGAYVAFLGDEGEARVRAAYPGRTWERLTEVKQRYDPSNFFSLNQNVAP